MSEKYREERKRYFAEQAERNRGYVWTVEEGEFAGVYRDMTHLKKTYKEHMAVLLDTFDDDEARSIEHIPFLKGKHPDPDKLDRVWPPPWATHGCWCETYHSGGKVRHF